MSADKRIADKLDNLIYDLERLDIWLDNPASDMTLGEYEDKRREIVESCAKSIEEMLGAGTCRKLPPTSGTECIAIRHGAIRHFGYWKCSSCGTECFEGARYCMNCGARAVSE